MDIRNGARGEERRAGRKRVLKDGLIVEEERKKGTKDEGKEGKLGKMYHYFCPQLRIKEEWMD